METGAETAGVYEFQDTKTAGTVTVVKKWDDQSSNEERPAVDMINISLSTQKPSRNPLGYTVTFHADAEKGLTFADGSTENEVVYNGSGQTVSGVYKKLVGGNGVVRWYTDRTYKEQIALDENGQMVRMLTADVDAWPKEVTFEISSSFKDIIPNTVTTVIFTDEIKPAGTAFINVDADGDGGAVAWTEKNGTVMKVSTQIKGIKVQSSPSRQMFDNMKNIQTINFTNFDTSKIKSMRYMFEDCKNLIRLDLSSFNTINVTDMAMMFSGCSNLTGLDLSSFDTTNVTDMASMFYQCNRLASLDVSSFNTSKVTNMASMFSHCNRLASLDVSSFNTSKVTDMRSMFDECGSLTNLNLLSFNTSKVTNMSYMFLRCRDLTSLDVSAFDTSNVTTMESMLYQCDTLATLTTGISFKFVGTNYGIFYTWRNTAGETFTSGTFPSNVADTYTRIK